MELIDAACIVNRISSVCLLKSHFLCSAHSPQRTRLNTVREMSVMERFRVYLPEGLQ